MSQQQAPAAVFEAVADGFRTGLAGVIGVRIRDNAGADATARTTAGIVEDIGGSGIYRTTLVAPAVAGQYSIVWDDGAGVYAVEDLLVTASIPVGVAAPGLSPRALTSLADMISFLDEDVHDAAINPLLVEHINSASEAIYDVGNGREFVANNARFAANGIDVIVDPQTRIIDVAPTPSGGLSDTVRIGDLARLDAVTVTPVYTNLLGGSVSVQLGELVQLPRNRNDWQPIRRLRFRSANGVAALYAPSEVAITGLWGFPKVPPQIAHWCRLTVKLWLDRDYARHGTTFSLSEDRVIVPRTLPAEVEKGVRRLANPRVGS